MFNLDQAVTTLQTNPKAGLHKFPPTGRDLTAAALQATVATQVKQNYLSKA